VFINNASVGFYSSMVQDPQNRSRRAAVTSRYGRWAIRGQWLSRDRWLIVGPRVVVPGNVSTILLSKERRSLHRTPRRTRSHKLRISSFVYGEVLTSG
jgi:hypothetical protein